MLITRQGGKRIIAATSAELLRRLQRYNRMQEHVAQLHEAKIAMQNRTTAVRLGLLPFGGNNA